MRYNTPLQPPESRMKAKKPKKSAGDATAKPTDTGATTGYEADLWRMADTLRGSMDAAEYKHVVLGLVFLKYISDAFEERHARLEEEQAQGADPEDPDEYRAGNIFWVPPEARWTHLKGQARQPTVGQLVDDAMTGIERDNPALKDVLPKNYARPALDKQRLGQLVDMISNIRVGDADARSKDVLGRVYEYFLSQFASAEGKKGGEFYTPRCVVKLLVEMLEPYKGRVYDPCCGSSGMFVQSVEFIRAHATGNGNGGKAPKGTKADISIYGQESNHTTWRLAKMNLAIRGIEGQIAHGDSFHNDRHPDLKADFILANPPFNVSDWGGERLTEDKRWQYGTPPKGNANFGWVQHMVYHLAPRGVAGFVLANGSMSSNQSGEGEIRKNLIEADLVDCMVALPGQLFYSTQIPACLWFLSRDRRVHHSPLEGESQKPSRQAPADAVGGLRDSHNVTPGVRGNGFRDRRSEILFIDARKLGRMVDRTHRELTDEDITRIANTYHTWRSTLPSLKSPSPLAGEGWGEGEKEYEGESGDRGATNSPSPLEVGEGRGEGEKESEGARSYTDVPGFCKSATLEEVRKHGHVLTPGRYVGAEPQEEDEEPFEDKMKRLTAQLREQQTEAAKLDKTIAGNLKALGFPIGGKDA